jgi:hypothetical protein
MRNLVVAIVLLSVLSYASCAGGWAALNLTNTIMLGCSAISGSSAYFVSESGNAQAGVFYTTDGGNTFNMINDNGKAIFPFTITMYNATVGITSGVSILSGATAYYQQSSSSFVPSVENSSPTLLMEQSLFSSVIAGTQGSGFATVGAFNERIQGIALSWNYGQTFQIINITSITLGATPGFGAFFPNAFIVSSTVEPPPQNNADLAKGEFLRMKNYGHVSIAVTRNGVKLIPNTLPANITGFWGEIDVSTDLGKTWRNIYTTSQYSFGSISCPTMSVCYIAAFDSENNNYVFKSADGGNTWNKYYTVQMAGASITTIQCVSVSECFAVGGGANNGLPWGYGLHLLNGSGTEQRISGALLMSLSMANSNFGYATGINVFQQMQAFKYSA